MTDPAKEEGRRAPVGVLYFVIFLTAIMGFVREAVLAAQFGLGRETDAFFFAYGLVQTCHDLIFSGSLSASIIPLLRPKVLEKGHDTSDERARFVSTLTLLVMGSALLLSTVLLFAFPSLVAFLAPEMVDPTLGFTLSFGRYLVWVLPANALVTLFTLILNAHNRFRLAAGVYLGSNLLFIAIILFFAPVFGDMALPMAGLAGPLFMAPVLARKLRRMDLLRRGCLDFSRAFFRSFLKLAGPSLATLGIGGTVGLLMTAHMILRGYAATFGQGGISAVGYAFRLYEAPISVLVNPAATLVFPAAVALFASGTTHDFAVMCRKILTWGLILVFPVAAVTYAGADPLITIMLQRGSFDLAAKALTTEALQGFAPAILFESVFVVFFRIFYAMHKPLVPVVVAAVTLGALVFLLHVVGADSLYGLSLMLSFAFALAALALVFELYRRFGPDVLPAFADIGRFCVAIVCCALPSFLLDGWLGVGLWQRICSLTLFLAIYPVAIAYFMPVQRKEALGAILPRLTALKGKIV